MLDHHETHGLGLRGLHLEARRGGDHAAALQYAMRANAHAPAAWAGQAVLDDRARRGDWAGALTTVDSNAAARLIDKPTANRWRAVIKTAMAEEAMERDPKGALVLAQEACRLAPTLVPAAAICGRLTARAGDYRRATRILEAAYRQTPHPDLAAAYLRVRHGDSAEDRLARARTLARVAPNDPESLLTVGRAALEAHDRGGARAAIAPLLASDGPHGRPTRRVCLLMADIEEAEGHQGAVREWLGRAARAPRDKAWVADGVISDRWAPVSPSGTLDAFVWRTPDERIAAPAEPLPAEPEKAPRGRGDRRACSGAGSCARARAGAASDRARAQRSACPGFRPRSRAAIGRHHRTGNDAARRPWPGGAGNEAAQLPIVRQQMTSKRMEGARPARPLGRRDAAPPRRSDRGRAVAARASRAAPLGAARRRPSQAWN